MINAISDSSPIGASAGASPTPLGDNAGNFDAALIAAQKAAERKRQHATELDDIKSKGFSAWVRDKQLEELKEKLRRQVMADMGLNEDSLSRLSAAMREILEQKIQEEVEKRMQEEMAKDQDKEQEKAATGVAAKTAAAHQPGKNDQQDGKTCPVIPALAWPGGTSLF